MLAAWLADSDTATPKKTIGVMTMDCGLSTQLIDLQDTVCDAGFFAYITFIIQLIATIYGIVAVSIIWLHDEQLSQAAYDIQLQQQLAVLTNNRGTWSIVAFGTLFPYARLRTVYFTTAVAVALEFVFAARGFLIGWRMNQLPDIVQSFAILAWLLPSAEALTLICGMHHFYL